VDSFSLLEPVAITALVVTAAYAVLVVFFFSHVDSRRRAGVQVAPAIAIMPRGLVQTFAFQRCVFSAAATKDEAPQTRLLVWCLRVAAIVHYVAVLAVVLTIGWIIYRLFFS
jgi:hypothetical protein